jgi:hypothetical protein
VQIGAAERIDDPVNRLILLQMVRAWLDAARAVRTDANDISGHRRTCAF